MVDLNHANIVKCFNSFQDDLSGNFNLDLEYCEGGDLNRKIFQSRNCEETFSEIQVSMAILNT